MPKITVHNSETGESSEFKAGYGANLRKAAIYNEVEIYKGLNSYLNCKGMGLCGKCLIEVDPPENVGALTLFEKIHRAQPNQRLGCRAKIYGDITIKTAIQD
ncbi:MAG: ferredoxin [Nitrospinota bacterium]|uniref:2Fe-2S ferredoxin-type domain-containing protein n=1 Tax=marine metagenome TaxID=408172 RepID=A0A382C0H8_9ZZZZ|nr:ferredoxin [Nitrospinota bacterium]